MKGMHFQEDNRAMDRTVCSAIQITKIIIACALIILPLFCFLLLEGADPVYAGTPVTLYRSFAGNIDFTSTGGTLRTQPNPVDACAVTDHGSAPLFDIPSGAVIRAAYLYWAGSYADRKGSTRRTPDYDITFEAYNLTADRTFTETFPFSGTNHDFFCGFADVTPIVAAKGNGTYSFGGLSVNSGAPHCGSKGVVAGWALVVVFEHPGEHFRVINLFDGFQYYWGSQIILTPGNFRIPVSPIEGRHAHISWEGDEENSNPLNGYTEGLIFNGNVLTDGLSPVNNQFNSTINSLGVDDSYGVDIDTYDISAYLHAGDTSATTIYRSGEDMVLLSAEIISVTNTPVADLAIAKNHAGGFTVGENGAYTIVVSNNGPHDAEGPITVSDTLPAGLDYVTSSGTGWTADTSALPVITWTHPGPLPEGEGLPPVTLTVSAGPAAVPQVTNTVTVSSPTFDNQAGNNSSSDPTAVLGPDTANKPLYLYGSPGLQLSRTPPQGSPASVTIQGNGRSVQWSMTPATAAPLTLAAGLHPVRLWISRDRKGTSRTLTVAIASTGATSGPIGDPVTRSFTISHGRRGTTQIPFNVSLPSEVTLLPGSRITLTVTNGSSHKDHSVTVHTSFEDESSRVDLNASTVIDIHTAGAYDAPYPGGAVPPCFLPGSPVHIRAMVADPFGSFDISGVTITIINPENFIVIANAPMPKVFDSGGSDAVYEYPYDLPSWPTGTWQAIIRAMEGTEDLVNDEYVFSFPVGGPEILVMKSVYTLSDPYNENVNPKAIPGATMLYTITITNQGIGPVDGNTMVITDPVPEHTSLFVNDIDAPGSGPLLFLDGTVPSGLTYTFTSLESATDDIDFSNDGGMTYTYVPLSDAQGFDGNVTHIRVSPQGAFQGSTTPPAPYADLKFKVRVN
ncbi:MAG: DUF3344 domain-containing protein [bacterium]